MTIAIEETVSPAGWWTVSDSDLGYPLLGLWPSHWLAAFHADQLEHDVPNSVAVTLTIIHAGELDDQLAA